MDGPTDLLILAALCGVVLGAVTTALVLMSDDRPDTLRWRRNPYAPPEPVGPDVLDLTDARV